MDDQKKPLLRGNAKNRHDLSDNEASWPKHNNKALVLDKVEMVVQINGKLRGRIIAPNNSDQDAVQSSDIESPYQTVAEYKPGARPLENFFGNKKGPAALVISYLTVADYARLQSCSKTLNKALKNVPEQNEIRSAYEALVQAMRSYKITRRITETLAFLYSAGLGFFLTKAEPNLLSDLLVPIVVIVPFATIRYGLHKMKEYERVVKATNESFNTLRNCLTIEALSGRNDTDNTMDEKKPETPEETNRPRL